MENKRSHNFRDLTGHRFSRLTVLSLHPIKSTNRQTIWLCSCKCGNKKLIRSHHLVSGETKSCGCLAKQKASERAKARTGPKHPKWAGGRSLSSDGYVKIYTPSHPRAQNGIYVYEHTLVMEQVIGRYLFPEETVHHLNGDRQDNRPENLELWSKNHGAGQRVNDQVNWAVSFLKRYAPELLK